MNPYTKRRFFSQQSFVMANAFAQRFMLIVDQLAKGNKKQFAQLTGKSASHIYKICRGMSRPSMGYLQDLYAEFQIDLNWLLTGERSDHATPTGRIENKDLVMTPMFDVQASAGLGQEVITEDVSDYFAFNKKWLSSQLRVSGDNLALVCVSGDSMLPTLNNGDDVLVDMSQKMVHKEGVYLLHTPQGLVTKRLKQHADGLLNVISDNSDFESWDIYPKDLEHNTIIGKVVWCARSI